MSKVLVDRELLDSAATWLEVHAPGGGCVEGSVAEDLRAILAQPAEAEGVELVPFWVLFDATTPEPLIKKHMPEGVLAFFDNIPKELHFHLAQTLTLLAATGKPILTFGLSKSGDPLHPLMLGYSTQLIPYAA